MTAAVGLPLAERGRLWRGNVTGTDSVALYVVFSVFGGNVAGKHFQATLCRCIGGNGLASELGHHRADVDDLAASLGNHSGNHGLGNDERGVQVNVYHLTEILHGHLGHRNALDYPGIVDQNVYRSQFGLYVGHHLLNLGLVGYVTDISAGFYALGPVVLQGLLQMMCAPAVECDSGSCLCVCLRNRETYSIGGSGHQCDLAFEREWIVHILSLLREGAFQRPPEVNQNFPNQRHLAAPTPAALRAAFVRV